MVDDPKAGPTPYVPVHSELYLAPESRLTVDYSAPAAEARKLSMDDVDQRVRDAVARHLGLVWRVLRRAGLNAADADDASQDVFWVLVRRHRDVPERSERAFLVATAMRVASDRRRSKWYRTSTEQLDEAMSSSTAAPDEHADARRRLAALDVALTTLDDAERSVLVLMDIEEFTKRETAQALGIPEGTVASRLRRARLSLKEALLIDPGSERNE